MDAITVWPGNDAERALSVDWDEALGAFAQSFYAQPKSVPMSIEERVHLFLESRYGTFVSPHSRDAGDRPSMSAEAYARFLQEAATQVS